MSSAAHQRSPTLWEEGRRPGREVVSLALALLLTATVLDLAFSEGLGLFFDLAFVTLCVGAALAVRPRDFFLVGVLPPLAMAFVVLLLAVSDRAAIARADDGVVQAVLAGLSRHGIALALGYAACLGLLALRRSFVERHPR
ncbi:DUF6542 domain-containing protein [Nocardioides nitrophenolicus]|uniref:DUF6542 domain-containing protein n=1 Tax=Nocardioides nitrophenolicus TaxID=60489 RepID=UPI00195A5877|nr:DUF6542 domain-containing protein [Nocardioides nitrophenolicus]MBM7516197.1 hypothetical protein [Nocardioides nitrophenolicus]